MSETPKIKRWCGRGAAGTETAGMNPMVEWHGDPDEDTPYVLASDYDALERKLRAAKDHVTLLKAHIAQLTAPGEYDELLPWLRDPVYQDWPHVSKDAATAIEQLQARVRMAETMLNDAQERFLAENDALRIRAEQAEARLAAYGRHRNYCKLGDPFEEEAICTCGFDAVRRKEGT